MSRKLFGLACLAVFALFALASPALAGPLPDAGTGAFRGTAIGIGFGAAVTMIGAGWGFGRIGAAALESMARQPEVQGRLFTTMLLIAALLEGATFFSLIVCLLMLLLGS
jgi:F-type H+-transporting ATPase subunit c